MKQIFSEHGKVIVSTLVVAALIAVCSIIRPVITDALDDMTGKLGNYVSERFSNVNDVGDLDKEEATTCKVTIFNRASHVVEQPPVPEIPSGISYPGGAPGGIGPDAPSPTPENPLIDATISVFVYSEEITSVNFEWDTMHKATIAVGDSIELTVNKGDYVYIFIGTEGEIYSETTLPYEEGVTNNSCFGVCRLFIVQEDGAIYANCSGRPFPGMIK